VNAGEQQARTGMPLVILGLGNLLLADDGVGVHAVRALGADPPPGAELVDVGTWVFSAQAAVERATAVIAIDAIDMEQPPGTIGRFELDTDAARPVPSSLHDFDLTAMITSMPRARRPRAVVLGVQPERVELGLELSAAVSAALPALLQAVRDLAARFGDDAL
jgi:hydrogenase maturation protease